MLKQVNSKFSTNKGAQIADKVATAVTKKAPKKVKAVTPAQQMTSVKKAMNNAAEKSLMKPAGATAIAKKVDTANTKSTAKINDDVRKARPSE